MDDREVEAFKARLEGELIEVEHTLAATGTEYWRGRRDGLRDMSRTFETYYRRPWRGESKPSSG